MPYFSSCPPSPPLLSFSFFFPPFLNCLVYKHNILWTLLKLLLFLAWHIATLQQRRLQNPQEAEGALGHGFMFEVLTSIVVICHLRTPLFNEQATYVWEWPQRWTPMQRVQRVYSQAVLRVWVTRSAPLLMTAQENTATFESAESAKLQIEVSEKPGEHLWVFCSSPCTKLQQLKRSLIELPPQRKRDLTALQDLLWPTYNWLQWGILQRIAHWVLGRMF